MSSVALSCGRQCGSNTGDFSFTTSPAGGNCGTTVAAGGSCTITVNFLPTALGNRSTTLVFANNASSSPQTISVSGTSSYKVQDCSNYTAGPQSSLSCTFASAPIGKSILCSPYLYDTTATFAGVSDGTNTYNAVASQTTQTGNGIQQSYLATGITGASPLTVTATLGGSSTHHGGMFCREYVLVNSLDPTVTSTGMSATMDSGFITIAGTNEVLFGAGLSSQGVTAPGVGYGNFFIDAGGNGFEDQIASSGTYNAQMTQASSGLFIMQIVALAQSTIVATPTFAPGAGTYTASQSVTISTSTTGSTLLYCTDSTNTNDKWTGTCTHGTTYSTAITVSSNETLKAVGGRVGIRISAVSERGHISASPFHAHIFANGWGDIGRDHSHIQFQRIQSDFLLESGQCSDHGPQWQLHEWKHREYCHCECHRDRLCHRHTIWVYRQRVASAAYTISAPTVSTPTITPGAPPANTAYHFPVTLTFDSPTPSITMCVTTDGVLPRNQETLAPMAHP